MVNVVVTGFDKKNFDQNGGISSGLFSFAAEEQTMDYTIQTNGSLGLTFNIDGHSGLTSYTIPNTGGDFPVEIVVPSASSLTSIIRGGYNIGYISDGTSYNLYTSERFSQMYVPRFGKSYVGSSAVTAIYLGQSLVYSASTGPAPSLNKTLTITNIEESMTMG